jgi:rhodanese-related sulfurtransferase
MNRASLLDQARKVVPEVSPQDALTELDSGAIDVLLDVREAYEWRKGYIDGAIRIALDEVPDKADPALEGHDSRLTEKQDARIVLYCATGVRSLLGGLALRNLGYSNVASLKGGIDAWKTAGNPTERTR